MATSNLINGVSNVNSNSQSNITPNFGGNIASNQNINGYGDDTNTADYGTVGYGGKADKYQGEGVGTTKVNYDPNLKTDQLGEMHYGQAAHEAEKTEDNYLAGRNDKIASALYNEGKTQESDVLDFLSGNQGFMDATAGEKANTVASIYKRLGDIIKQEQAKEKEQPEIGLEDPSKQETGAIYGRETGEESYLDGSISHGTKTFNDPNSIDQKMYEARKSTFESLQAMDSYSIAAAIVNGYTPGNLRGMKDLQMYDPEKYNEIQAYVKDMNAQNTINSIANGEGHGTAYTENESKNIENDISNWVNKNSDERTKEEVTTQINESLNSSITATNAKQEMLNIQKDIAVLNNRLKNLPEEAKKAFKGDVPDYFYSAYIANNQQKIQNDLSILEARYNSAVDLYKTEVAEKQREAEMSLKERQFALDVNNTKREQDYKERALEKDNIKRDSKGNAYKITADGVVKLDDATAKTEYNNKVASNVERAKSLIGSTGIGNGQCESLTDDFAKRTAGVEMVGAQGKYTTSKEKNAYATNPYVSDTIPQVGDVAVFDYSKAPAGASGITDASRTYGHTRYVTGVYKDSNGNYMVEMIGQNEPGATKDGGKGVKKITMSLDDFYNKKYGVGFWNPFKQAQYNAGYTTSSTNGYVQTPMDKIIDAKNTSDLKQGQSENLGNFQHYWNDIYTAKQMGGLDALLNEGMIGNMFKQRQQSLSRGERDSIKQGTWMTVVNNFTNWLSQNTGEGDEALIGYLAILGLIEGKLREESGAKIGQNERDMDFLQYLPMGTDTDLVKRNKMQRLENVLVGYATRSGITTDEYIPLFSDYTKGSGKRSTD